MFHLEIESVPFFSGKSKTKDAANIAFSVL